MQKHQHFLYLNLKKAVILALGIWEKEIQAKVQSPWLLLRLVRVASDLDMNDRLKLLIPSINSNFQNRAWVEFFRGQLANLHQADPEAFDLAAKDKTNPLVMEITCRHNARFLTTSNLLGSIENLDPSLQPFAFIGMAHGEKDKAEGVK